MVSLKEEFRRLNQGRTKVIVLRPTDAMALVRKCRERKLRVLGIDAFYLSAATTQPDMGESIDLSTDQFCDQDSWTLAEQFLNQRLDKGLHFEVVFEKE